MPRQKKIYINPKVPQWMDFKDIEERSESHLAKWWGRAYIRTEEWSSEPYQEYKARLLDLGYDIESEEDYNKRKAEYKESWFKSWPTGIRYDVRILDGGAWDRTTWKGSFNNLEEAISLCKELMS